MTPAPILLAIDTATAVCSVALAVGAQVHESSEVVGQRHSERLLPMVEALLRAHDVTLADCAAIAFGAGPGSFTGLRIACAVAQGLAWGVQRPVVPVGHLEAIAWQARQWAPAARRVAAVIDARMGEAYCAVIDVGGTAPAVVVPPTLIAAGDLAALLAARAIDTLAGEGVAIFADELAALDVRWRVPAARAGAGLIAQLARPVFVLGQAVPAAQAAPLYVRDRVALTIEERAARRRAQG